MGGAGGHMRHPHDLNEVGDGKDVIALFRAIPKYLKSKEFAGGETSSLKLDGSNNGLRLAYRDGRYQFVIDRGSKMELDVQGVSADQLEDRFKGKVTTDPVTGEKIATPHGMVASSRALLDMMNEPLQEAPDEMFAALKELGFLVETEGRLMPDPTKYLSIEYVERVKFDHPENPELGRANVIYYPFDFIAFHGVSEFFEMVAKVGVQKGEVVRQGPKPGPEDDGPGKPIPYNRAALNKLVELVTPYAPEGFRVFGPVSLKVAAEAGEDGEDVEGATDEALVQLAENIERALNTNISIRTSADPNMPPLTMTLEEWLSKAKNFNYKPDIKIKQIVNDEVRIRKVSPFHKDIHQALINDQKSVSELVEDPEIGTDECDLSGKLYACEKALYGAIFLEAARILGNTVKESLMPAVEEFGPAVSQEGVVIDAGMPFGKKKTGHAFKITGEFIVDASGGAYATQTKEAPPPGLREDEEDEWYSPEHETRADAKFADRYGEESVDLNIIDDENTDPVGGGTIAIVPGAFKPPHQGHADMVRQYAQMADEVVVLISKPLKQARKLPNGREITAEDSLKIWDLLVGDLPNVTVGIFNDPAIRSPMSAAYAIAGAPADREAAAAKVEPGMDAIQPGTEIILGASTKGGDANRWTTAEKYIGGGPEGDLILIDPATTAVSPSGRADGEPYSATDMRELLGDAQNNTASLEEYIGKGNVPKLLSILGLEGALEEMSAMGNGPVAGGSTGGVPLRRSSSGPGPGNRDVKKKRKKKKNEYLDLSMIDEIYELLSERGVIK